MNNKRILIVGVLAVIVTLMVGYALFSETISINGTATAKGDFSITTTCQMGLPSDSAYNSAKEYFERYGYIEGGYDNDYCTVNGNNVSFGADLKYPGASRYFMITLKNTGSIPALFDGIDSTDKQCRDLDDDGVAETCRYDTYYDMEMFDSYEYFIKKDGTIIGPYDEDVDLTEFEVEEGEFLLQPETGIVLLMSINWSEHHDSEKYNGVLNTHEISFTYNVTQYTE